MVFETKRLIAQSRFSSSQLFPLTSLLRIFILDTSRFTYILLFKYLFTYNIYIRSFEIFYLLFIQIFSLKEMY